MAIPLFVCFRYRIYYLCCLLYLLTPLAAAYDTLMVAGGYYYENGGNHHLSFVEVIGRNSSCAIAPLPEPRFGLTLSRLRRTVVACGGYHVYERPTCYTYFPARNVWVNNVNLTSPLAFSASAGEKSNLYVAGGRRYDHSLADWNYTARVWKYSARFRHWTRLPDLNQPTADACLVVFNGDLFLVGGSRGRYRYADEPSRLWVLHRGGRRWEDGGPILAPRMWHSCIIANVRGEIGIVVAGGYYNGIATMFLPLTSSLSASASSSSPSRPRWAWLGSLPAERKWGPALGSVDGNLVVAGGRNYGDDTLDRFYPQEGVWRRQMGSDGRRLLRKREFASHVTVPSQWFPQCQF